MLSNRLCIYYTLILFVACLVHAAAAMAVYTAFDSGLPSVTIDLLVYLIPSILIGWMFVRTNAQEPSNRQLWWHSAQLTMLAAGTLLMVWSMVRVFNTTDYCTPGWRYDMLPLGFVVFHFPITRLIYGLVVRLEFAKQAIAIRNSF
ncbi:MAG: ABZJ_00895 family protein [Pikeienuella sp.]